MNILMTGATGFLGFPLLNKLVVNGHKVTIITRETSDLTRIIQLSAPINVITLSGESLNNEIEFKLCEAGKFDLIIHAATDYNRVDTLYSPGFINAMLPIFLLNFAIKYKVEKFINFDTFFNKKNELYPFLIQNSANKLNWSYFNNQATFAFNSENDQINFNIRRVKFKPGYMNL